MNKTKYYWEYSFDLDVKKLKAHYGKSNYTNAYKEVGDYLFENGFDNKSQKQGSCYFTSKKYTAIKIDSIIAKMYKDLVWLPLCVNPKKEALTVKSEIEYSHEDYIESLTHDPEQMRRYEKYIESINKPKEKGSLLKKLGDKTSEAKRINKERAAHNKEMPVKNKSNERT